MSSINPATLPISKGFFKLLEFMAIDCMIVLVYSFCEGILLWERVNENLIILKVLSIIGWNTELGRIS